MLAGLGALVLAACETGPGTPAEMDAAAFETAVSDAGDAWHPYASVASLNKLIEEHALSAEQKARALYRRGRIRTEARIQLPQAIEDLTEAGTLAPTRSFGPTVATLLEQARTDLDAARGRLSGLQNLPNWFDDKVAAGELDEAAHRFRESGLSPDPIDAGLLEAAGYLCRKALGNSDDWQFGDDNEHLKKLEWCSSANIS
jgi:hypothetical protein